MGYRCIIASVTTGHSDIGNIVRRLVISRPQEYHQMVDCSCVSYNRVAMEESFSASLASGSGRGNACTKAGMRRDRNSEGPRSFLGGRSVDDVYIQAWISVGQLQPATNRCKE